ncbi:MAG TPA: type I DNA topoisomerase [Chloroflexi bacterium]|nr:type I DNA topoisomerase [Chloroflexota bacterium]
MTELTIEAYCVKCRTKRVMQDPEPVYLENGRAATKGICPVCGSTLFRMGETPAHSNIPKPDPPKPKGKLVIVESPAKARTVGKFLGKGYTVKASIGHVRDLLRSKLSVDVENGFKPRYRVPNEKKEVVKEIQAAAKKAAEVYLATDPDREGEAIAWHLLQAARIPKNKVRRVVFHEITKSAIEEAFSHPRDIDMNLVNAQQARRILDRLVGYKLSPLLWRKVRNRTSAGRVQSVALRLIVEREREIQSFVPEEYWSIKAKLAKQVPERPTFIAKLVRIRNEEVNLKNKEETDKVVAELEKASYLVYNIKRGTRKKNPAPPFTTSTMQQEASKQLGFTAKKTMMVAQQLYEGVPLGEEGPVGLITYMRTDSVQVAEVAQQEARRFITERFGEDFLPQKPPKYKTRAKIAQEAHEAIRPTSVYREPKAIKQYLTRDQYRLYDLIWKRFIASQMAPAIYDTMSVDIVADGGGKPEAGYLFRATGSSIRFPGFLLVYQEARDEDAPPEEEEGISIPPLEKGERLDLVQLLPEQHFTQPPPRYTEASLVRTLEEYGIGRPSTYAPIISTLYTRGYVQRDGKRLVPTEIGFIVNDLLVEHFPDLINVDFTARMEEDLDRIAAGEKDWVGMLREFYGPFEEAVARADRIIEKVELPEEETGMVCEKCGSPMVVKWGRYGKFIACSNYPACRNTKPYMVKTGAICPECGGDLVERKTRRGRTFYGCINYPECNFATWKRPLPRPCPSCGGLLVVANKDEAQCLQCEETFPLDEVEGEGQEA